MRESIGRLGRKDSAMLLDNGFKCAISTPCAPIRTHSLLPGRSIHLGRSRQTSMSGWLLVERQQPPDVNQWSSGGSLTLDRRLPLNAHLNLPLKVRKNLRRFP